MESEKRMKITIPVEVASIAHMKLSWQQKNYTLNVRGIEQEPGEFLRAGDLYLPASFVFTKEAVKGFYAGQWLSVTIEERIPSTLNKELKGTS